MLTVLRLGKIKRAQQAGRSLLGKALVCARAEFNVRSR